MDADRMHALACRYAAEQTDAHLQAALEASLPLCALIARRFAHRGVEYEDLYQIACLACVGALKRFDVSREMKFTTFVTPTVTGAVRNAVRDQAGLLRSPRALLQQSAQLARIREAFCQRERREPTARELADALGWDVERVLTALSHPAARAPLSLDQEDGDGLPLAARLPFLETGFDRSEQRADLEKALEALSPLEQELMALRYKQRLSQRDAARRLGISQMQVSRMERRILTALRKELTPPA